MLSSSVFIEAYPRRTSAFFSSLPPAHCPLSSDLSERVASTPRSRVSLPFALPVFLPTIHHPLTTAHCSLNSFPVNSFADPHPLSPLESYCFKKGGGRGAPHLTHRCSSVSRLPYALPSSVSRKSCICHSYENTGGVGVFFPLWNSSHGVGDRTYPCAIIGFAACASAKKASRE
jgi:hypothetical protein